MRRVFARAFFVALCLGFCATSPNIFAGTLEEIKSVSGLPAFDLAKLKQGDVVSARGPLGNFTRGVCGESIFFVPGSPEKVAARLVHWNPAIHPELDIHLLHNYRWPASELDWAALELSATRAEDRWLIERTRNRSGDLHLASADFGSIDSGEAEMFWRKILRARDADLANGGLVALPSYASGKLQITARNEFDSLMSLTPASTRRFATLLKGAPFNRGAAPEEFIPYWEMALVRGHTQVHAGFIAARKNGASWQVADCTYYTSDTYFFSITLYELIAAENGTLIWQTDFVSAPFRNFVGGVDRAIAGSQMLKETAQAARLFRKDVESGN